MANILRKIVQHKKKEVEQRKKQLPMSEILNQLVTAPPTRPFKAKIRQHEGLALIAEIKHASPSKGTLMAKWDPKGLARTYQENGACAISLVTDEKFFKGRLDAIAEVKSVCSLPVLRKDFIIDPYQIYESRLARADAVLLIASLYPKNRDLKKMMQLALNMSLTPVVEVGTLAELQRIVRLEPEFIGINNRDLATFKTDIKKTAKLIKKVPEGTTVVSESGIENGKDARELFNMGVKAILVGEALLKAKRRAELVKELATIKEL